MHLQSLVYLCALARERHFGRAAAACFVTQPTLSSGIRRLEQQLGVQIVQRSRRFEGLTPEGERVLRWAQRIVHDWDALQRDLGTMRSEGLTGRLRLGAIPTSLPSVSALTVALRERHPGISVQVLSLSSREIERGLHDFDLHAGVTYLDNEPLHGVRTLHLYEERYLLLTQADGPLADAETVTWAQAAELPLCLLTPDMQNRRIVESIFRSAGAIPRPAMETNSISTLHAHVLRGGFSSVVAHPWLHEHGLPPTLRAIPLVEPVVTHSIGLVTLDRDPEPLLAAALVDAARRVDVGAVVVTPAPVGPAPGQRSGE